MKNVSKQGTNIGSENQSGGITAEHVTINNYNAWSNNLGKINLIFKRKAGKWSAFAAICVGLVFCVKTFFGSQITTKDEFYQFLLNYLESVDRKDTDANDYFVDNISVFYQERNINPDQVNEIRKTSDYKDSRNNIDKQSITIRKGANGINYWRFIGAMICYRPSKDKFQKCNVEMEYGLNSDNKITSIEQIKYWDLIFTEERPE